MGERFVGGRAAWRQWWAGWKFYYVERRPEVGRSATLSLDTCLMEVQGKQVGNRVYCSVSEPAEV